MPFDCKQKDPDTLAQPIVSFKFHGLLRFMDLLLEGRIRSVNYLSNTLLVDCDFIDRCLKALNLRP